MLRKLKSDIVKTRAYGALLYLAGFTSGCSLGLAMAASRQQRAMDLATASIANASELVSSDGEYELWQTPFGHYWIPMRPLSRESLFEMLGERKVQVYGGTRNGVQEGDVVVDCGSNIGTFVAEALDAGAERVVACEPSPANVECLHRNFANHISSGRVTICAKGLWDQITSLRLKFGGSPAGDSFIGDNRSGIDIPVTTIDWLVEDLRLERVNFIKMDVEGAERNVLRGSHAIIRRFSPRLAVSAYHLPDDPEVLVGEVRKAYSGYRQACHHARLVSRGLLHSRIAPMVFFFRA